MSGEVARSARIARNALEPGDVVFFGDRGAWSAPAEVGHMGIYVGNDWIVHSSRFGTTLTPMKDWYETRFAWGRRPLAEADRPGLVPPLRPDSAASVLGVDGPSLYWTPDDGAAGPVAISCGTTEKSRLLTSKK